VNGRVIWGLRNKRDDTDADATSQNDEHDHHISDDNEDDDDNVSDDSQTEYQKAKEEEEASLREMQEEQQIRRERCRAFVDICQGVPVKIAKRTTLPTTQAMNQLAAVTTRPVRKCAAGTTKAVMNRGLRAPLPNSPDTVHLALIEKKPSKRWQSLHTRREANARAAKLKEEKKNAQLVKENPNQRFEWIVESGKPQ